MLGSREMFYEALKEEQWVLDIEENDLRSIQREPMSARYRRKPIYEVLKEANCGCGRERA